MRPGARNDLTDVAGFAVGHHQRTRPGLADRHDGRAPAARHRRRRRRARRRTGHPRDRPARPAQHGQPRRRHLPDRRQRLRPRRGRRRDGLAGAAAAGASRSAPSPHHVVPIVPAAVIFDLGAGGHFDHRPDASFGRRAAAAATPPAGAPGHRRRRHRRPRRGAEGRRRVGERRARQRASPSPRSSSSTPAAARSTRRPGCCGVRRYGLGDEFAELRRPSRGDLAAFRAIPWPPRPPTPNTTLAVVATDAGLDKAECTRVAGAGARRDGPGDQPDPHLHRRRRGVRPGHRRAGGARGADRRVHPPGRGALHPARADHRRRRRRRHPGHRPRHAAGDRRPATCAATPTYCRRRCASSPTRMAVAVRCPRRAPRWRSPAGRCGLG